MTSMTQESGARLRPSRVLSLVERARREFEHGLTPAERLAAAFELSQDLRRLFFAGLQAQGFTEEETESRFFTRTEWRSATSSTRSTGSWARPRFPTP
jgi:hypothetical protein